MLQRSAATPRQSTDRPLSRTWSALLITAATFAVGSFLVCEIVDLDIFWNVVIGHDILSRHAVPHFDRYTTAGLGHPYHDIHWLFQVVAAIAHAAGGWTGVELLQILIWGATLGLLFHMASRAAGPLVATVLVVTAAVASAERFLPRPEIVTFFGLVVFVHGLQGGTYRRRSMLLLIGLQFVWANAHGLFVLGPFLVGCYLLDALAERRSSDARSLLKLLLSCLAVSVITPYGARSWSYAVMLVSQVGSQATPLMRAIGELSPTFGEPFRHSPAFWAFLLLFALTAVLLMESIVSRRAVPLALTVATVTMALLAFTGRRNVVLFALVCVPLLAELSVRIERLERLSCSAVAAGGTVLACAVLAIYPLSGQVPLETRGISERARRAAARERRPRRSGGDLLENRGGVSAKCGSTKRARLVRLSA